MVATLPSSTNLTLSKSPQRLGRALWCLARHGGIQNALELFTGIGGAECPNPPNRNGEV